MPREISPEFGDLVVLLPAEQDSDAQPGNQEIVSGGKANRRLFVY